MRNGIHVTIHPAYSGKANLIGSVPERFSLLGPAIHAKRNTLIKVEVDGWVWIIKSYRKPHLLNRYIYSLFRPSKAHRAYEHAMQLEEMQIPTPAPVAYLEVVRFNALQESYFISLFCPYSHNFFEICDKPIEEVSHFLRCFTRFAFYLHERGVLHHDFSRGNILFEPDEEGYRFPLIDINRMEFRVLSPKERLRNFGRLRATPDQYAFMAKEYALLSGLDESFCLEQMLSSDAADRRRVEKNQRLKQWLGIKKRRQ